MRPASQRFFIHSCIYLLILIISYLATFLGNNSLSVLMCRKAVNQSINQSINQSKTVEVAQLGVTRGQGFCLGLGLYEHTCIFKSHELVESVCLSDIFVNENKNKNENNDPFVHENEN